MMKFTSSAQKKARMSGHRFSPDTSAGHNGRAIAPPAYGIDGVDNRPVADVSEQTRGPQSLEATSWPVGHNSIQRKSALPNLGNDSSEEKAENKTGLPDKLKAGIETLSGLALDDVRVHYNSPKPARLQALAYTQGTDIHVGSGQERHLPHEAWHVVQQRQGRVQPTTRLKGTMINDKPALEDEATTMGTRAAAQRVHHAPQARLQPTPYRGPAIVQRSNVSNYLENNVDESIRQDVRDMTKLYAAAQHEVGTENVPGVAVKLTKKLASETNGHEKIRKLPGIKKMPRAVFKADVKKKKDYTKLTDIVGTSIVYEDLDALYSAVQKLRRIFKKDNDISLVDFKNRFKNPTPEGYRDMLLNIRLKSGHVMEIQLHVQALIDVKKKGHEAYKEKRTLSEVDEFLLYPAFQTMLRKASVKDESSEAAWKHINRMRKARGVEPLPREKWDADMSDLLKAKTLETKRAKMKAILTQEGARIYGPVWKKMKREVDKKLNETLGYKGVAYPRAKPGREIKSAKAQRTQFLSVIDKLERWKFATETSKAQKLTHTYNELFDSEEIQDQHFELLKEVHEAIKKGYALHKELGSWVTVIAEAEGSD